MSFCVVFYDQFGNELQREALKYGTVPEYKTWLPEGFDKWVYKKSGKDVETLKATTGNTYYQTVCYEVYHSSSEPTPGPTPIDASSYTLKAGNAWFGSFTTTTDKTKISDIYLLIPFHQDQLKMLILQQIQLETLKVILFQMEVTIKFTL